MVRAFRVHGKSELLLLVELRVGSRQLKVKAAQIPHSATRNANKRNRRAASVASERRKLPCRQGLGCSKTVHIFNDNRKCGTSVPRGVDRVDSR